MPSGQIWVWQLAFSLLVHILNVSPWHLLWLSVVSIVLSITIARILHNLKISSRIKEDEAGLLESEEISVHPRQEDHIVSWLQRTTALQIEDESRRAEFLALMQEFPLLSKQIDASWGQTFKMAYPFSIWRLTIMLNEIAITLANRDDFSTANTCLRCSSLFIKGNPLTWATSALVAFKWEDKVAIKWATKVINYRITQNTTDEIRQQLSTAQGKELLKAERKRMKLIIKYCNCLSLNDDWRDTSILVEQVGTSDLYFDL